MADRGEGREAGTCPACAGAGCRRCSGRGSLLQLHTGGVVPGAPPTPVPVRLVREFKGPTLDGLLDLEEHEVARLPQRLEEVLEAVEDGALAAADDALDRALAPLHRGPGHHRPGRLFRWMCIWFLVLLGALLAVVVGAGAVR